MTSEFIVHNAVGYEQLMGRWSQKLAPQFIEFAGIDNGERILDVGCGTGSLTFALARAAELNEIAAIDYSPVCRGSDPAQHRPANKGPAGGCLRPAVRGRHF
jgi:2-polyprenyl-3-methyl-5-hydroxy-6-metoxy-1,4-benzoquinol methylase